MHEVPVCAARTARGSIEELLTVWLFLSAFLADDDKLTRLLSTERIAAIHRQIAAHPHVAGSVGGRVQAELIAQILRGFGLKTETHSYWALLSYPRRMTLRLFPNSQSTQGVILSLNERSDARDPDTAAIDLLPGFIAYSATGRVRGAVVNAGYGLPADYDALEKSGVSVKDKIALVRFGHALVSEKAQEAEKRSVAGVVFYNDPADDIAAKPASAKSAAPRPSRWPDGPARASWFVERGAASRDPVPPRIPLVVVSWSVAEQVLPIRKKGPPPATELEIETHMNDSPRPIFNVIATVGGSEQLHLDPQPLVHGHVGAQRSLVLRPDCHQVASPMKAGVGPEHLGGVLQYFERAPGHGGQGPDTVVTPDHAARLAGTSRPDGGALQHHHLAGSEFGQGPSRTQSGYSSADHDDVGGLVDAHPPDRSPGIQSVPARGTWAMAEASMVNAARSSGSRWWTSDFPQARARAVTSMVMARR